MKRVFGIFITVSNVLLFLATGLYLLSGFGITDYRIVQAITFGLLGKANSLRIHEILWIPFAVLLVFHIFIYVSISVSSKRK